MCIRGLPFNVLAVFGVIVTSAFSLGVTLGVTFLVIFVAFGVTFVFLGVTFLGVTFLGVTFLEVDFLGVTFLLGVTFFLAATLVVVGVTWASLGVSFTRTFVVLGAAFGEVFTVFFTGDLLRPLGVDALGFLAGLVALLGILERFPAGLEGSLGDLAAVALVLLAADFLAGLRALGLVVSGLLKDLMLKVTSLSAGLTEPSGLTGVGGRRAVKSIGMGTFLLRVGLGFSGDNIVLISNVAMVARRLPGGRVAGEWKTLEKTEPRLARVSAGDVEEAAW